MRLLFCYTPECAFPGAVVGRQVSDWVRKPRERWCLARYVH